MRVFFSIRYDTIRYEGLKEDLLFEEFLANFQNFRRIFGEFSEFSANFWNFRRKKTKNSLVLRISRYTIWEVRYDILFDIRKSPISRHSINSRYDKLCLGHEGVGHLVTPLPHVVFLAQLLHGCLQNLSQAS